MARSPIDIIKNLRKTSTSIVNRGKDFFRDENVGGIAKNTILGLPAAKDRVEKKVGKFVIDTAKEIVKGGARVAVSTGEVIPRALMPGASAKVLKPQKLPGFLGAIGPIESYQSAAARATEEGQSIPKTLAKTAGQIAVDEPVGVAFKPLFLAGSILARNVLKSELRVPIKNIVSGLSETILKSVNKAAPEYESILKAVKAGEELPPIPVYKLEDGKYALNKDGAKRFLAHQEAGVKDINVKVEPKTNMTASAKQAFERKLYEKPPTLSPETKDNIVSIIDDHRLNKGKDLSLQEDAARIAEDLNLPKSKTYGELVNQLEDVLARQPDDVRSVIKPTGETKIPITRVDEAGKTKRGIFETAVENLKDPRKRQGGFIRNPLADDSDLFKKGDRTPKLEGESKQLGSGLPPLTKRVNQAKLSKPPSSLSKISSLQNDTKKLANSQVNLDRFDISNESKNIIKNVVDDVKPKIEAKVGSVLSNKEALDFAERSSRVINQAAGRQATLEWESALIRSRQKLAQAAETGTVDREFIDTLLSIKSQATDIGRKLQSFSIAAEPKDITSKQAIIEAVLGVTDNVDEILKAAKDVDFTNLKEATEFYRKFIKPTTSEWVDLLRYNSMLSSPKTHIVNVFSNAINSTIVPVVEKAVAGSLDFLGSSLTGKERQMFAGEAGSYLKGYVKNFKDATTRFSDVLKGTRRYSNLDVRNLPIAVSGTKGKVVSALSYPMRLLEGADQFFTALTEGGEAASLGLRKAKGGAVGSIAEAAENKAAYRLYRRELFSEEQGPVLDALDQMTQMVQNLRKSKNPIVSNIAKFTVPFLQTPMNIFKQGVEYSPAGFSTIMGATNKTEQLAKAIIGSSVFAGAATMLMSNRLSWAEPINPDEKAAFRDAGKQAYSMKIGDKWVSYQKLPPPVAFPFAMAALIDDSIKNRKISQDTGDLILSTIAKYGSFLSDQSYAKSIGDLLSAVQGGESAISKLVSNYPQQLIPFRALSGWIARLADSVQRKPDDSAGFIDKQVQLLMMNIPGLSKKVPARTNELGEEIKQQLPVVNAFSPVNVTEENAGKAETYEAVRKNKIEEANYKFQNKTILQKITPIYNDIQQLKASGKNAEAIARFNELSDQEKDAYKNYKASIVSSQTSQDKKNILPTFQKIRSLKEEGKDQEALQTYNALSDDQKKAYQLVKKQKDREAKVAEGAKPKFEEGEQTDSKGVIDTAILYAKALGTDPVTAFNRIFSGQKIRYLANDAIVVERLALDDSEDIKKERGGDNSTMKLDHRIPLQLGGSNSEDNLILVPTAQWKSFTPVENAIGKALREKKINKKRAQQLIGDFKDGILTADEVSEALK